MDLTIIIVNWNGGELLMRCLRSIRASRTAFLVRVIVVDNDSSDGSRELAASEFPEYRIVNSGSNLGFGKGNNFARTFVETPFVLILNPDTELLEDTLQIAVDYLRSHPDIGLLGCQMLYPDMSVQKLGLQWFPSPWTILLEGLLVTREPPKQLLSLLPILDPCRSASVRKLYGGFFLAPKAVLDRAGWFDDRYFMYAEDVDLSRTIRDMGYVIYYLAECKTIHVAGGTSSKAPSGFSVLMKHRSINQLICKYSGFLGGLGHRLAVLLGSSIRLMVIMPAWFLAAVGRTPLRASCSGSAFRHGISIAWALGLKKPFVPSHPALKQPAAKAEAVLRSGD